MVPTAFGVIRPSNFQNFLWLRSPYTFSGYRNYAWYVTPSGVVDINISINDNVDNSYGAFIPIIYSEFIQKYWWLRSPETFDFFVGNHAWRVTQSGGVNNYSVTISYGKDEAVLMHQIFINIGG